jgi:hypothetical protein
MALRKSSSPADPPGTSIFPGYYVEVVSKNPFKTIDGQPFCVWQYRISSAAGSATLGATQIGVFRSRLGLVFSARIDIKRPELYPECAAVQDTSILRPPNDDKQYVFKNVPLTALIPDKIDIFFIAACEEDHFTPIRLVGANAEGGAWVDVPFRVDPQSGLCATQVIRGPAILTSVSQAPPGPPPSPSSGPVPPPEPPVPEPGPAPQPAPAPQPTPAPAPAPSVPSTAGGVLAGASRRIPKATYVPLKLDGPLPETGAAIAKNSFLMALNLKPGEVSAVGDTMMASENIGVPDATAIGVLQSFEGTRMRSLLPTLDTLATIPTTTLRDFGRVLLDYRKQNLQASEGSDVGADAIMSYNAGIAAVNAFEVAILVAPVGWLNLERLVMTPVGIQRGELIATIPLAPLEQTAVVHKEWSVTTKEFTSIVTDSLENYSETGVTENTELAQSTTSQVSHSNQFNINATVSGSYGPVTATVASGFTSQDQSSLNAAESRKHAISTTRKASSRVKQEHKVTISTTTVTGTSETSTRVLQNPSPTNAMRIDYFSLMRKWHVGLYRYGLRMTYDIAIPEPAAAMRRVYADLADLRSKIGPFVFPVKLSEVTTDIRPNEGNKPHYLWLADQYQVAVPPPPDSPGPTLFPNQDIPGLGGGWHWFKFTFSVDDGYRIAKVRFLAHIGDQGSQYWWKVEGVGVEHKGWAAYWDEDLSQYHFLEHETGEQTVTVWFRDAAQTWAGLKIETEPTPAKVEEWRSAVFGALLNAAQTQYYEQQQDIAAQIAALEDKISNVDTLTLRREENEEIMKGVLRWLLGPTFDFIPSDVASAFTDKNWFDLVHGIVAESEALVVDKGAIVQTGHEFPVDAKSWAPTVLYGEMVKFINEAIEWENVLYFVYPYFWDVPASWHFIQQIRHPDSTRQAFLRAGSARVVLTVRPGWEDAWVRFVEVGKYGLVPLPDDHPYLSLAKEIQLYDQTNYRGIPPANPAGGPLPDDGESVATVSKSVVKPSSDPNDATVTIPVKSSAGFIVGRTAIIDTWDAKDPTRNPNDPDSTLQEVQTIVDVPDVTHIKVEKIINTHDGTKNPIPIMQAGEKGQLIAEWFEYTPTSGTDIAVTSNLASIA